MIYTCDCSSTVETTYTFSKRYETNLNFEFLGYKYIELVDTKSFDGLLSITDPLDENKLTLKPWATHPDPIIAAKITAESA